MSDPSYSLGRCPNCGKALAVPPYPVTDGVNCEGCGKLLIRLNQGLTAFFLDVESCRVMVDDGIYRIHPLLASLELTRRPFLPIQSTNPAAQMMSEINVSFSCPSLGRVAGILFRLLEFENLAWVLVEDSGEWQYYEVPVDLLEEVPRTPP